MTSQSKPTIRVAAAALALSACGIAVGICGGTPVAHAGVVSARHAPGNTGFADPRDLAEVKRDAAGSGVQRARAQTQPGTSSFADLRDLAQVKRDAGWAAVQRARAAAPADSALAACTALSGGQPAAASDYPKIAAQFAGSRWPDLRRSGLAYVEIATQLLATHAYEARPFGSTSGCPPPVPSTGGRWTTDRDTGSVVLLAAPSAGNRQGPGRRERARVSVRS